MQGLPTESGRLDPLGDNPLVTIAVASLNQGAYIEETIVSVLSQDYDSIELVIIDGGSADQTLDILRKYETDSRLRWISEPDDGPNDGFRKGLIEAKGELVGLQTSSDPYQPGVVREAVQRFLADPLLTLVSGGIQEIDESGKHNGVTWDVPKQVLRYSLEEIVSIKPPPLLQPTIFRRDIALRIGGFPLGLPGENHFYLQYMLEASKLGGHSVRVPQVWVNFRRHPNPMHHIFQDRNIRLRSFYERNLFCKQIAEKYKHHLTSEQSKTLRRLGYRDELKYRVQDLHQIGPAIPSLWGYLRFGGRLNGILLKRRQHLLAYFGLWLQSKMRRVVGKIH